MIELIIFDLDGVLADTEEMHRESLLDAIEYTISIDRKNFEHLFLVDGTTTKDKLQKLKNEYNLSDLDIQLIDDKKQQNVLRYFFRGIKSSPDQHKMFSELSKKYKLGVASNSRKENVIHILNILGIAGYFNRILSNNDVEKPKPDPEIFLSMMNGLGVHPANTLILEDSDAGKKAAVLSGAHLLPIDDIKEVTLENIDNAIQKINS